MGNLASSFWQNDLLAFFLLLVFCFLLLLPNSFYQSVNLLAISRRDGKLIEEACADSGWFNPNLLLEKH